MYYKSNPNNYTRCEKCKYIDRENEQCKITNDNWLVSDKAGTCHQFEGVESMKVRCIDNAGFEEYLELGEIYDVLDYNKTHYGIYDNNNDATLYWSKDKFKLLDNDISRIDLVLKTDNFLEYDYKQDVIGCRCPSEFGLKEYRNEQCNSTDDTCCLRCWNELATKEETERLLNAHKRQEFEEQMEKIGELASKCSISGEELLIIL